MITRTNKLILVALMVLGCSGEGDPVGLDTAATIDIATDGTADQDSATLEVSLPEETSKDTLIELRTLETTEELVFVECDPGEGCFLDKCTENSQCQSGWCVEHMGEGVCSRNCSDECPAGWTCKQVGASDPDLVYVCVSNHSNLCKPCASTEGCKAVGGAEDVCVDYGDGGSFCGGQCEVPADCPWGFICDEAVTVDGIITSQCVAEAEVCPCTAKSIALSLWAPCQVVSEFGVCPGKRVCTEEGLSDCDAQAPAVETCNGVDDDCDGNTDEPAEIDGDYVNLCNDDNDCTDDNCKGSEGCQYELLTEGECLDGDPCTVADHCQDGECVGNPVLCDDGNQCTDDTCDGAGGCQFANNAADCDDEDPCSVADQCSDGECTGYQVPCDCQADADCAALEDGDICNGTLHCDLDDWPYKCSVDPDTVVTCPTPDEGPDQLCLQAACEPDTGLCSLAPNHAGYSCDDGDACTVGDKCEEGACLPGVELICADSSPCTDDSCDPVAGGCVFVENDGACDDDNACTLGDHCEGGFCVVDGALDCNDGNPCTADSCSLEDGCVHTNQAGACDDGNPCTINDACLAGACVAGPEVDCNDGNPCTDDSCGDQGLCIHSANQAECNDSNECTIGDHCAGGTCSYDSLMQCADDNPCTDEICDPAQGCMTSLNDSVCSDNNLCTTNDHCHLGQCISSGQLNCNDNNSCTDDACDPNAGCTFSPNNVDCDDGSVCTDGDQCGAGWCVPGTVLDCDDSNPCTDDACDAIDGCYFTPNNADCDDLNACTEFDQCANEACGPGQAVVCDDNDPCTVDGCEPATGCTTEPAQNGTQCGFLPGESCQGGNCVCTKDCLGKDCGPDACGGECGTCSGQDVCIVDQCVCVPACAGKECGDDGCNGDCGPCPGGHVCKIDECVEQSCGLGQVFGNGCVWSSPGGDLFVVPSGVSSVTVTMIGGGGGGGSGYYYPGGGGGSGYYVIKQSYGVTPGANLLVQVGSGSGMGSPGSASKFGTLTVDGGKQGQPHNGNTGQASAKGGNGGSGGGAGYTNSSNGGGIGSGIPMQGMAGGGGVPSPGPNKNAWTGQGYGAGGGGDSGTSGYNSNCGGTGGTNGGNGITVGGCGGGGGGAGGLVVPGFNNPSSQQNTTGVDVNPIEHI